jgi:long-chain-fatty-acid--CoA ligase ACSBG
MGYNAPEWAIACYGAMFHNNIITGVYITNEPAACQYQAQHSEAEVIVVDTEQQLRTYLSFADTLLDLKAIICWGLDKVPQDLSTDSRLYTFKKLLELGKGVQDKVIDEIISCQRPGMCCCLIYTSGTTGNPKGVMLSHDNLIYASQNLYCDVTAYLPPDQ